MFYNFVLGLLTGFIGMNMFINDSDPFAFYGDYIYPGGPLWDGENLIQDRPFPK